MDWKEKFEKGVNQGLDTSKKILHKAKYRAKELGDQGVLAFEIRQLEAKHTDLLTKLGSKVHELLIVEERSTVTKKSGGVKEILEDIDQTRDLLEEKRAQKKHTENGAGTHSEPDSEAAQQKEDSKEASEGAQ